MQFIFGYMDSDLEVLVLIAIYSLILSIKITSPHCGFTISMQVENLVTKRSAEITGPGQFDTSEFSKQVNIFFFV